MPLATIVPSGPGYPGTFELTPVGIAGTFEIGRDEAFAIALLVHASILAVTSLGGVVAFIGPGLGLPLPAPARVPVRSPERGTVGRRRR